MNPFVRLLCICLFLSGITGCNYYEVSTRSPVKPEELRWEVFNGKYLIVHSADRYWLLSKPVIAGEGLSGTLEPVPKGMEPFLLYDPHGSVRYKNQDSYQVLNMVQLIIKDPQATVYQPGNVIHLDPTDIDRMVIYMKDKSRSTMSKVIPGVVVPVFAVGLVAGIVALTKSSCPLVYIKTDKGYDFAGEIFGGAVDGTQERHDYLPLPGIRPERNRFRLAISNGLPEVQYINLAELWIVHHPGNVGVLPDRHGTIRTVTRPILPLQALSSAGSDLRPLISSKDQQCYLFNESPSVTGDTNAFNSVTLSFPATEEAGTGKLVIRAGNSYWGDYTYGEFTKLFGNNYNKWVRKQGKAQADRNARWKLDQKFALLAFLETETGWQFIDYFDLIGPMGVRDLVMPVALKGARVSTDPSQQRVIRIRLESGFKFWDLDYAAMDFSPDPVYRIDHVAPVKATTESGTDVTFPLSFNDTNYYVQYKTGEQGFVEYRIPSPAASLTTSVILHSKGYYEHVRNYPNPPDWPAVESFLIPGRFSRFSWQNYTEFVKNNTVFISDPNLP